MVTRVCSRCKVEQPIENFTKDKYQKGGRKCQCKACIHEVFQRFKGSPEYNKVREKAVALRKKLKETDPKLQWAKDAIANAKKRAKQANVECTITREWLLENLVEVCPLLEIKLEYSATKYGNNCASIDRIDSTRGYTVENSKIISAKANRIKNNATIEEIQLLAKNLAYY